MLKKPHFWLSVFRARLIFYCQVMLILQKTSSAVAKHLITVCKGHCNLWSALPRLAYQSKASQGQQASRTALRSLRQLTTSDVFRCLACSGPHIADRDGLSEPYSCSKRMMSPSISKIKSIGMATTIFPCTTDQPQMWSKEVSYTHDWNHPSPQKSH